MGLALPPNWNNTMTGLAQSQIKSGTPYIFGRAASQGGIYVGGSSQMYISNLKKSDSLNSKIYKRRKI